MHQNGSEPTDKGDFETRPRPVPPPGTIASASLPGYRRAGVGAGCVDPLPPTAPPRHLYGACKPSRGVVLGRASRSRTSQVRSLRRAPCVLATLGFRPLKFPDLLAYRALRALEMTYSVFGPSACR